MVARAHRVPVERTTGASLETYLSAHRLFGVLPKDAIRRLAAAVIERTYAKGHHPFYVGDPSAAVFAVKSGIVAIAEADRFGGEQILATYVAGDVFGLSSTLSGLPRTSTATALTAATVFIVPRGIFDEFYLRFPELAYQVNRELRGMLRRYARAACRLAQTPVSSRIAAFLFESLAGAADGEASPPAVDIALSRGDMALVLGTTRETVNRVFARLHRARVIAVKGRSVTVRQSEVLRRYAEG
ncbi:MAG: Crp/Fnr family transcriptional regulator [Chloroflexi bacterium]|nr:Crp/Fnr family transcriptional regulator [Chloroflexota bacterium]